MQLLIMRHGEAEPFNGSLLDKQRMLTPAGQVQAELAAASLAATPPDLMLVSPFVRTQQTADIVRAHLVGQTGAQLPWQTCDWLQSEMPVDMAIDGLQDYAVGCLLLVSHMPLVSLLVAYLTGQQVGFQPANIAEITLEYLGREQGEFRWRHQ